MKFQLKSEGGKIEITGTTGVVAATGLHYYLKYFCNAHISWEVSQLNLPSEFPEAEVEVPLNDRYVMSFYFHLGKNDDQVFN